MKSVKYILMVISMVGVLSVNAQPQTEQPQVQFQSTSTLQTSGSTYSSTPTLGADGTVSDPYTPTGPRRAPKPINDDQYLEDHPELGTGLSTPVGDAVLPLMLMAVAFAGVIYLRRRKARAEQ